MLSPLAVVRQGTHDSILTSGSDTIAEAVNDALISEGGPEVGERRGTRHKRADTPKEHPTERQTDQESLFLASGGGGEGAATGPTRGRAYQVRPRKASSPAVKSYINTHASSLVQICKSL